MKPTIAAYIDTRRKKKNDLYPSKIRITYKRVRKYYSLPLEFSLKEWDNMNSLNCKGKLKEQKKLINAFIEKAELIINEIPLFSFAEFEEKYFINKTDKNNVYQCFEKYIKELEIRNQIGTYQSYSNALISFKKFKPLLRFNEVNKTFLDGYMDWMLSKGNSKTTIGIYCRYLRKLYNDAIRSGVCKIVDYPFGRGKFEIPKGSNTKKALKPEQIRKMLDYIPIGDEVEEKGRDFFIFSYFGNGINLGDVCRLKYENIEGNTISFVRQKTANTKENKQVLRFTLNEETKRIISRYGNLPIPGNYIFSILTKGLTPLQEKQKIKQFIKDVNKGLEKIGKRFEFKTKLRSYGARHTYATTLKRKGISTEMIGEMLGHSDVKTTNAYLDSIIDEDVMIDISSILANV